MKASAARREKRAYRYGVVETPLGRFRIVIGPRGLISVELRPDSLGALERRLERALGARVALERDDRAPMLRQIAEYAAGKRRRFQTKLDWSLVTGKTKHLGGAGAPPNNETAAGAPPNNETAAGAPPNNETAAGAPPSNRTAAPPNNFGRRVLGELAKVRFGHTLSYGELARRAGSPGAARAVGAVMAKNPIPLVVPCHRVLAAGGKIGGFTGGLGLKRALLDLEKRAR